MDPSPAPPPPDSRFQLSRQWRIGDVLMVVGFMGAMTTAFWSVYGSYNERFQKVNDQAYVLQKQVELMDNRLKWAEAGLKEVKDAQDQTYRYIRDRIDEILAKISLIERGAYVSPNTNPSVRH